MTTVSQRSFSGGEITPALYGRVDQVKYSTGLRTCRNFIVQRHGGVTNRSGTAFVCEVEDSSDVARITEFIFNDSQTYVLLWGDLTLRIVKNGVLQREAAKTITGITAADPAVVTSTSHGYTDGDEVYLTDVLGMTEVNQRSFLVANKTANTFELQTKDGEDLDASAFTAYSSAGSSEKVYQVTTPYLVADLPELHFVQSADVVTICHPTYAPRELSRTGDIVWALATISFLPTTSHPTTLAAVNGGGTGSTIKYKVTAVNAETGEESLPAVIGTTATISGATAANPVVITATAHGYSDGDVVLIEAVVGMTELNSRRFTVENKTTNTFELKDENGLTHTAYSSAGTAKAEFATLTNVGKPSAGSNDHTLSWDVVSGVTEYNIYRAVDNAFGFIGTAETNAYTDSGVILVNEEDSTDTPPADRNPFLFTGNYPSTVTFHQQRRVFANTDNNVEKVWASRSGDFSNFTKRKPIQDDDEVTFNIAGLKVNEVQSMITVNGQLVLMSVDGEWAIQGNVSGVLSANDSPNPAQYTFNGSSKLQPILINDTAIYVQNRENRIRELSAEADFSKYGGDDLTIFSTHLFENKTITDMAFQQIPHSVGWFIRSDGVLLGMTKLKEQEILAWHRHDFENGTTESVASVPEGNEDAVYVLVKRTIEVQGVEKTVRYLERFNERVVADVEDYIFMDSSITVDGTNTAATTMTLTTGGGWDYDDDLTLTSSVAHFASGDVGVVEIHMTDSLNDIVRLEITGFTSTTVVTVRPHKIVPTTMQATALTTWGDAVGVIKGLWHLEGQQVSVFADGFVNASVNNPSHTAVTVSDGEVILDNKFVVTHVGLPITSDIETLDVDTDQGESLADRKSNTSRVVLTVESSRGIWGGTSEPTGNTLTGLYELKQRDDEGLETPVDLATENASINLESGWTQGGRVFIRQVDPVPCSILSVHGSGYYAFRG